MRIYPAIRAQMGDWKYYIVRMKMREVAQDIKLAQDIYEDRTLSDAVQRELGEKRVKKEIVGYLSARDDRFFSSIVVAAIEGEPVWHPVEMDTSVVPAVFSQSASLRDSFGVLSFGDEPKYYALDGQHRVTAIKLLVNGEADFDTPAGFDDELLSVIVVLREEHDVPDTEWLRRYRRLFSSLNRWAKKTDNDTNIIMDEDDLFAILTRRLITDHRFFKAPGRDKESYRVLTKGKAIKVGTSHFTALQTLYAMTETLLTTRQRVNRGWPCWEDGKIDKQVRPDEEFIDGCYDELAGYWDAMLGAVPELEGNPKVMRGQDYNELEGKVGDSLLFRPITQEVFAKIVRWKLDEEYDSGSADLDRMVGALRPLSRLPWELRKAPWRNLLLVPSPKKPGDWVIRNEDRKPVLEVTMHLMQWMLGDALSEDRVQELRADWEEYLYRVPEHDAIADMWQQVEDTRARIVTTDQM